MDEFKFCVEPMNRTRVVCCSSRRLTITAGFAFAVQGMFWDVYIFDAYISAA